MRIFLAVLYFALSIGLVACATSMDALRTRTARVLGFSPEEVRITNVMSDASNTYYLAKTPDGEYACTAESGVQKAMQFGLTNPPICKKK